MLLPDHATVPQQFSFNGYLPIDSNEKRTALKKLENLVRQTGFTQIFMETPYRNEKLIEEMIKTLHPDTKLCIAADIGEADEFIETRLVTKWKQHPNLHKRPAVFVLVESLFTSRASSPDRMHRRLTHRIAAHRRTSPHFALVRFVAAHHSNLHRSSTTRRPATPRR